MQQLVFKYSSEGHCFIVVCSVKIVWDVREANYYSC